MQLQAHIFNTCILTSWDPCHLLRTVLTCINCFPQWPGAWPLLNTLAETVTKMLISHWVLRFGMPSTITTNRGCQFDSHLFTKLIYFLRCKHTHTSACHPAANIIVKRFQCQLKEAIKAYPSYLNWLKYLPLILLGIQSMVKEEVGHSPAELF